MPGARVAETFFCALFVTFCPGEFGGQDGECSRDNEKSRARQHNHGNAGKQHERANNGNDHLFKLRFQLKAKVPQKVFSAKWLTR
jgi:hypothetical protein